MGPTSVSGFNQIGGHSFQWDVLRSSLGTWVIQVGLVLIRLVDMGFSQIF